MINIIIHFVDKKVSIYILNSMTDGEVPGKIPETETKPRYTLAIENFQVFPADIVNYHPGDLVTRNNFVSFVNNSFAISRGFLTAQEAYFAWLDHHEGFDAKSALKNFLLAGGAEVLTDTEKQAIVDAYRNVRMHAKADQIVLEKLPVHLRQFAQVTDEIILKDFTAQISDLLNPNRTQNKPPFKIAPAEIKKVSLGELNSRISKHAKAHSLYR